MAIVKLQCLSLAPEKLHAAPEKDNPALLLVSRDDDIGLWFWTRYFSESLPADSWTQVIMKRFAVIKSLR